MSFISTIGNWFKTFTSFFKPKEVPEPTFTIYVGTEEARIEIVYPHKLELTEEQAEWLEERLKESLKKIFKSIIDE